MQQLPAKPNNNDIFHWKDLEITCADGAWLQMGFSFNIYDEKETFFFAIFTWRKTKSKMKNHWNEQTECENFT